MIKLKNKTLNIPKSFEIGGNKIIVEIDDKHNTAENHGACWLGAGRIVLRTNSNGDKFSADYMSTVFYHELVHLILDVMNEYDLSKNEKFVDVFATLLHQFNKTRK